jgi:hypothetical protein
MRPTQDPAPLSGGDRAGIRHAEQQSFTRNSLKTQVRQRLRRQHLARRIHDLGPRELDRAHGLGDDLDNRLERYAGLDPVLIAEVGGDRFPASPMRMVASAGQ